MTGLDDEMGGAADEQPSEASGWVGRVADATNDFESIGPEIAAEVGL